MSGGKITRIYKALTFVTLPDGAPQKTLKEALINAIIVAGVSFFSTLAGLGASGLLTDPTKALVSAGVSAGLAFFTLLAIERDLIPSETQRP